MLFSSITFLYFFLPLVLLAYCLVPDKGRNAVLLLASLFFYFWGEPKYVLLMLLSISCGYGFGILIDRYRGQKRCKLLFAAAVVVLLSALLIFKYTDFFIANVNWLIGTQIPFVHLILPIGISFYTFQILSYLIDLYRGTVTVQKNWLKLATFIALFPQLIAGPIVRYTDIASELESRVHTPKKSYEGISRFIVGLSKKVLLANQFGTLCDIFRKTDEKSVLFYWLYGTAFCLQIYFDFSGYSDMAIGLGKLFAFDFPENFNYPFCARSITDFWRRWHMTLGSWFRDYVYIPLGGNRVKKARFLFNIALVWFLTGFWHGADWTFIVWGLYFAVLLIFEKLFLKDFLLKRPHFFQHIYVLFHVLISFMIFNADGLFMAFQDLSGLFGGHAFSNSLTLYYLRSYLVTLLIGIIGATPLPKKIFLRIRCAKKAEKTLCFAEPLFMAVLILLCTAYLIDGSFNPFLYFRF